MVRINNAPAVAQEHCPIARRVRLTDVRSEFEPSSSCPRKCQIPEIGFTFGQAEHSILIVQLFPFPLGNRSEWRLRSRVGGDIPGWQVNERTKRLPSEPQRRNF